MFLFKLAWRSRAGAGLLILLAGIVPIGCALDGPMETGEALSDTTDGADASEGGDATTGTDTADGASGGTGDEQSAVGGQHDSLSMPASATVAVASFRQAAECAGCHPNHYAEWKTSMHSYAMIDPVFRALVELRQADFGGRDDQFCTQCHSAIGTRGGEITPGFSFEDLSPVTLEGVTCEACHKVSELQRPYNSGHVLDETGPIRGPIEDPFYTTGHESEFSPLHDTSEFCAGCHDVVEQDGLNLERPYAEWLDSPAATAGRNCQSCHMPTYRGKAAELTRIPERDGLHRHRFLGVDMPLDDDFIPDEAVRQEIRGEIAALLQAAGRIELETTTREVQAGQDILVDVTVRNLIDGHNLPTGSTFNRQLWVALTATDALGNLFYQTGDLDNNGDLRNYWSELDPNGDPDLLSFGSDFVDADGNPTVFPWRAVEHISHTISPLGLKTSTLTIPTHQNTVGPITIHANLRFRPFPPFILRALGLADLVEMLETYEMDMDVLTVGITTE